MSSNPLSVIEEVRRLARGHLDRRAEGIERREAAARRELEACAAERADVEKERSILDQADRIYRDALNGSAARVPEPPVVATAPDAAAGASIPSPLRPVRKARIGPQRYRMFLALRQEMGLATVESIAALARLDARRVKEQMQSDAELGYVAQHAADAFGLTPAGQDLLARYEAYKRSKGQVLPTLDDPPGAEDASGADPETTNEGEEG